MKALLIALFTMVLSVFSATAQNTLNNKADNILGDYYARQNDDNFKVRFSKLPNGTYMAQIYWVENDKDENGRKALDVKNPDKSLRNVPCDRIVLIKGLRYNAEKKQWDGAKVYDPQRGIRANVVCKFRKDGMLWVRGTVLGIGEDAFWEKIK